VTVPIPEKLVREKLMSLRKSGYLKFKIYNDCLKVGRQDVDEAKKIVDVWCQKLIKKQFYVDPSNTEILTMEDRKKMLELEKAYDVQLQSNATPYKNINLDRSAPSKMYTHRCSNGKKILFYLGDALQIDADAIVNSANEFLTNGAGIADAISKNAGPNFQAVCRARIRNHEKLKTGTSFSIPGGDLI